MKINETMFQNFQLNVISVSVKNVTTPSGYCNHCPASLLVLACTTDLSSLSPECDV
jgi:hypothetical protein